MRIARPRPPRLRPRPRRLLVAALGLGLLTVAGAVASPVAANPGGRRCGPAGPSDVTHDVAGHRYTAALYRPVSAAKGTRWPLVIDLHGLYADGPSQAALSRFRELAEGSERPFLVVEPTGQPGPLGGAGWEIAALDEPLRDDAAYLTRLIETMVSEHCADPRRVYLAGYSNGGIFAAEYACANPGRVAAVAAVAGFSHLDGCARPSPVIVLHGTGDPVVPYDANGGSILLTDETPPELAVQLRRGIEPQVQAAAKAAGCKAPPERTALSHDVDRFAWRGCDHGNRLELYRITGGGHTWPGAPEQPDAELIGATTASIDATQLAWDFFLRHTGRPRGDHR